MLFIVGLILVIVSVVAGYMGSGGHMGVLWQPFEFIIIFGAAIGGFVIANPKRVQAGTLKALGKLLKGPKYTKASYVELLSVLFAVFKLARTKGDLALESHVDKPQDSPLFQKFPGFLGDKHAVEFLCDYLRLITLGTSNPHEIEMVMEAELEADHAESVAIAGALRALADGLPALGIVAAVLGVIHTMGSITEPPEVLGHLIGGALVGTFSGVLAAYGVAGPIASSLESTFHAEFRYVECIKVGVIAHMQGYAPQVAVEIARKTLEPRSRPSFGELEEVLQSVQAQTLPRMASGQPLIIKRIKRSSHAAHHGGAWKVAYADFVTAMMAFFLLLWLLNVVTDEQLHGIADYFAPMNTTATNSGAGGILSGETISARHNYPNRAGPPNASFEVSAPRQGEAETEPLDDSEQPGTDHAFGKLEGTGSGIASEDLDRLLREREEEQFRDAEERLREALENKPELKLLAKSLIIDNTPEGLRIQIHDQDAVAMFPRGSTEMYLHTRRLLELIGGVIMQMPQQVAISGHTDATPYVRDNGYGNWELSADRANAARRVILAHGVPESRVSRVVGKAATEPLIVDEPAAPANRRLSVVLLRGASADEAEVGDSRAIPAH